MSVVLSQFNTDYKQWNH